MFQSIISSAKAAIFKTVNSIAASSVAINSIVDARSQLTHVDKATDSKYAFEGDSSYYDDGGSDASDSSDSDDGGSDASMSPSSTPTSQGSTCWSFLFNH